MRVLLDESIPVDFARELEAFDTQTVIGLGWAGLKNGALLREAAGQFQVLLRPLVPQIRDAVEASEPGKIRVVSS